MASGNCLYQVAGTWENYLVCTYIGRAKKLFKETHTLTEGKNCLGVFKNVNKTGSLFS